MERKNHSNGLIKVLIILSLGIIEKYISEGKYF